MDFETGSFCFLPGSGELWARRAFLKRQNNREKEKEKFRKKNPPHSPTWLSLSPSFYFCLLTICVCVCGIFVCIFFVADNRHDM